MPVEFLPPAEELTQGDLILDVPSTYVANLAYMVKFERNLFRIEPRKPANRRADRTYPANAEEAREPGIVLTHDCEIDKRPKRAAVTVALIRPLDGVSDEEDKQGIREYTRHRAFYLPPSEPLPNETYVDFRRPTVIRYDALMQLERVARMNEEGIRMLQEHLFRFYTRRVLPDDWHTWPEEDR